MHTNIADPGNLVTGITGHKRQETGAPQYQYNPERVQIVTKAKSVNLLLSCVVYASMNKTC